MNLSYELALWIPSLGAVFADPGSQMEMRVKRDCVYFPLRITIEKTPWMKETYGLLIQLGVRKFDDLGVGVIISLLSSLVISWLRNSHTLFYISVSSLDASVLIPSHVSTSCYHFAICMHYITSSHPSSLILIPIALPSSLILCRLPMGHSVEEPFGKGSGQVQ